MANSKTEHSKNLRKKSSTIAKKEAKARGEFLAICIELWDINYINKAKNIVNKTQFFKNALDNLDVEGNPK